MYTNTRDKTRLYQSYFDLKDNKKIYGTVKNVKNM